VLVPFVPSGTNQNCSTRKPRQAGSAKVDEDTLCNVCNGNINHRAPKPELNWEHSDEDPGIDGVKEDLEKRIEGYQPSRIRCRLWPAHSIR